MTVRVRQKPAPDWLRTRLAPAAGTAGTALLRTARAAPSFIRSRWSLATIR